MSDQYEDGDEATFIDDNYTWKLKMGSGDETGNPSTAVAGEQETSAGADPYINPIYGKNINTK
jgi:hypothetical protein